MSLASRIRHSFIGYIVRRVLHVLYRLRNPRAIPVEYSVPAGLRIQLYPEGEVAEFLAFPRLFERTELALVAAYLKPGMKVADVGANVGLYSIVAQKLVGPAGVVWAFEPSPESFRRLKRNLTLNNCLQVQPFQVALSDQSDAMLALRSDRGYGDAYRYLANPSADPQVDDEDPDLVPVTTLDHWAARHGAETIDFLKVDIEGGEFRMFLGARRLLASSPDVVVVFESESDWCRRAGCSQEDTFKLLESVGLKLFVWGNHAPTTWVRDRSSLLEGPMIWACRDPGRLPMI